MKPVFTIDWEPYFALYPYSQFWEETDTLVEEPTMYLLDLLRRHQIKAIWYCLGWLRFKSNNLFLEISEENHRIGRHTYYHDKYEVTDDDLQDPLFRSPRFYGQKRLYSGGFWFRVMPYWWIKRKILKEGCMFIHPHDVMLEHPKLPNPWQNWYRNVGLKTARDKLERLCREVEFEQKL